MDSAFDPDPTHGEKAAKAATAAAPDEQQQQAQLPSIEDDVKQLAGSISSWWSSFSSESQRQLNDVRKRVDAQGGLVSMAKREAARFEQQLSDAQQAARKGVEASTSSEAAADGTEDGARRASTSRRISTQLDYDSWGTVGAVGIESETNDGGKPSAGKSKAKEAVQADDEGDDGAAVERLEERTRLAKDKQKAESASGVEQAGAGQALFDADDDAQHNDRPTYSPKSEFKVIEDAAQSAMLGVQSFWKQLQTDERVGKLQASMAKTLQNISVPSAAGATKSDGSEADGQANSQAVLPDLSKQFQASFPTLDWKQSQTMAKRYFEASQSAARDLSKEMSHFMSDLVQIVPPSSATTSSPPTSQEASASTSATSRSTASAPAAGAGRGARDGAAPVGSTAPPIATAMTEEDEFDWDKEMDTDPGLETTTGPQTSSWEDDADSHTGGFASQVQTVSEADEASERKAGTAGQHADEEDSDWE